MSNVTDVLKEYSKDVVATIEENLGVIEPQELQDASIYLTKAGGKMLRPALTLISAEAVGGNKEDALKTAAAIELIHTFSLIHDDIMDDDDMRRGMPSVHKVWDEPLAILAGDTLFSKAFEMVILSKDDNAEPEHVANALATVADACVKICEGQASDMSFEGNFDVTEEEYSKMIYKKTGALIAAATKAGAIMGGADEETVTALYEYGRMIGIAFQIQDDYLDVISDEADLGKPVGSDIAKGKMTLMVVKALAESEGEDNERLLEILKEEDSSQENVNEAIDLFNKYGSIEYAHNLALENIEGAKKAIDILEDSEAKDMLIALADFVIDRSS
ncbi:short chain isoprenyl diphosphate synthase IdsA [uncultured Methanobrevibacter sp.]|uniref:short chain isoprenyl diphosphate synthase IdsA n=1 Tax=uncultured Methanobrevibacter sp. TaxID=253161 RepID=UPI0026038D25